MMRRDQLPSDAPDEGVGATGTDRATIRRLCVGSSGRPHEYDPVEQAEGRVSSVGVEFLAPPREEPASNASSRRLGRDGSRRLRGPSRVGLCTQFIGY
jgi:hypothetical protein